MQDNFIMTIDQINKLEPCSFIYKYTKNLLPPCFFNLFQHNIIGNDLQINTRSQSKFCFCNLIFVIIFCRPYTLEMVLLTHGRISFGRFFCLPDPFWVLTLLVTEFVVSPTHDYATFSLYDSDVYILL